jgi:aryl-alcohol dehydrogenase-like predicted oxidoreductase
MRFAPLAFTELQVSRICLGTAFRSAADVETCEQVVRESADLGCNFIDCANVYRDGVSEEIVGRAVAGRRDQFVIATKVGGELSGAPASGGLHSASISAACDDSLRRLNTDYIDLYLCHFPDPRTPLEETLAALEQLRRQGKIRFAGCCNYPAAEIQSAVQLARARDWQPFVCSQVPYSLLQRGIEAQLLPACAELGLAVTAFAPTAIGLLSGRFRRGSPPPRGTPWQSGPYNFAAAMTPEVDRIIVAVADVARRFGKTLTQVALAWCLSVRNQSPPSSGRTPCSTSTKTARPPTGRCRLTNWQHSIASAPVSSLRFARTVQAASRSRPECVHLESW